MSRIVMKFGGTSVADLERIRLVTQGFGAAEIFDQRSNIPQEPFATANGCDVPTGKQ